MTRIDSEITINAPPERTWAVLGDLTAVRHYMPGIAQVEMASEARSGVGAARHCVFKDGVELSERVIEWTEGVGYVLETTSFKGVPMKSNVITFSIDGSGRTSTVSQSMRYEMKGGIFAPIMERMARGMMRKAVRGALNGLKSHVEP